MAVRAPFDPDRMAHFEGAGWRAYYDRDWLKLVRLTLGLFGEQFHIPLPMSLLAAYYITRASIAWAPAQPDEVKTLVYLEKFYHLARRYSDLSFDPARAAQLELQYWVVHRRLTGQSDQSEFVDALAALHSEVFGLPPAQTRVSAEQRVLAATTVDRITSGASTDIEGDWARIQGELQACYRSIRHELDAEEPNPETAAGWSLRA